MEKPSPEMIDQWHRWFAVECNNSAWDLASRSSRTSAENEEMINLAYAAVLHWSKVGKPIHQARADVTLAHALALAGHGELALRHAQRCLAFFEANPAEDWDIAFAHAEVAHAAAVEGNASLHAKHYALAQEHGQVIQDETDRKIFLDELSRIPNQVRTE
jgi:hypothetical protein